ncbi:hypothetical protein DyAD56_21780 [Dyella sp. AD56]|nr:hypothetical protein DyAD56_21780 [Dyella sp. AD56]
MAEGWRGMALLFGDMDICGLMLLTSAKKTPHVGGVFLLLIGAYLLALT